MTAYDPYSEGHEYSYLAFEVDGSILVEGGPELDENSPHGAFLWACNHVADMQWVYDEIRASWVAGCVDGAKASLRTGA